MADKKQGPNFVANNQPVGSAGQPIKKEVPEAKGKAISRRMQKLKDKKK